MVKMVKDKDSFLFFQLFPLFINSYKCAMQQGVQGKAARHARQDRAACKAEIPTPNKKANCKLP